MASRTGMVIKGSDGSDFSHREKIASHYEIRDWTLARPIPAHVLYKSRLSNAIIAHLVLASVLVLKLVPFLLDRGLNVFILAVEEWEVPEPQLWELVWLVGANTSMVGFAAIRRNNKQTLQVYAWFVTVLCVVPLLAALNTFRGDLLTLCGGGSDVVRWQGTPLAALVALFVLLALQVHAGALYCCYRLAQAWKGKAKKN